MKEAIKNYIDELFADAPKTRKAMELKEEVAQNTIEKYQDLIAEGYQEQDAYQIVINSIGDVTELFEELKEQNPLILSREDRKKKAVLTAAAVGIYIFAGVIFLIYRIIARKFFFTFPEMDLLGLAITALICIPPTCMLVYAAHMYPDYKKEEDTLVEVYKENLHTRNKEKALQTSVSVIIWMLTITIYFIISFVTSAWHVTWIAFLIGGCIQAITALVFSLRRDK